MRYARLIFTVAAIAACGDTDTEVTPQASSRDSANASSVAVSDPSAPADSDAVTATEDQPRRFAVEELLVGGVGLHMREPDVLTALGEPTTRRVQYWDLVDDTVRTWHYQSVSVEFWGNHGVAGIRCSAAPCATSQGVGIGSDAAALDRAFGPRYRSAGDSVRVVGFEPANGCALVIRLRAARVFGIEIVCEI